MGGRIDVEPFLRDFGAAIGAPAVLVLLHSAKRGFDPGALQRPAAMGFLRHLLTLQQIHPGKTPDRRLVERDSGAFILAGCVQYGQFGEPIGEASANLCDVSVQNL